MNDAPPTFDALLDAARRRVDAKLEAWLPPRVAAAKAISADVGVAAEALAALTLRGGKRMRAALVVAGYAAAARNGAFSDVLAACDPALIAIELLQTYLLVHDDWMDDDAVRRGGPAVHVSLRERFGSRALGDAGAVLVGDLASGYAQEALLGGADRAPGAALRAARVFARIQTDVVQGQLAEMCAAASGREPVAVETIQALKTASYTVTGPLLLGAALAGGGDQEAAQLERFGRPLGVAFQLRDDLLGVFGDSAATGKPVGSDVRQGKQTALVAALRASGGADAEALLARTLGDRDASAEDVAAVVRAMTHSGARANVEARIGALCAEARAALPRAEPARTWLAGAIAALAERAA